MRLATAAIESWEGWAGLASGEAPRSFSSQVQDLLARRMNLLLRPPSAEHRGEVGGGAPFDASADRLALEAASKQGVRPKSFWPEGKPYAVCITHDIDRTVATYQRLRGLRKGAVRALTAGAADTLTAVLPGLKQYNPFFNFGAIREIESQLGVKSAYYVLFERRRAFMALSRAEPQHFFGVYQPEEISPQLRALVAEGHELGIHLSFSSWKDGEALDGELRRLRKLGVEESPVGARSHYLCFSDTLTPKLEVRAGFRYDSSIGFNFQAGFRAGTCFPYRLGPILELPLHVMDTALRSMSSDESDWSKIARRVRDEVRSVGGVLMLNWHAHLMNSRVSGGMTELLIQLIEEAQGDGAWIALPREIAQWWERRTCRS